MQGAKQELLYMRKKSIIIKTYFLVYFVFAVM